MNSGKFKFLSRKNTLLLVGVILLAFAVVFLLLSGFRVSLEKSPLAPAELTAGVNLAGISLPFVENQGQWDSRVRFRADLFSGALLITEEELVYGLVSARSGKVQQDVGNEDYPAPGPNSSRLLVFKEKFLTTDGRKLLLAPAGKEIAGTAVSYFGSPVSASWKIGLPSYNSLKLGSIYPGIEVELKAAAGNVEKYFYLAPGARVEDINIKVEGIEDLTLSNNGNLILNSGAGSLEMVRPAGYQEIAGQRIPVQVAYEIRGQNEYGFSISGSYDPNFTLVIDPALSTLSASTFIGGTGNDRGYCIAVSPAGKVYVAGYTVSIFKSDFPTTTGVFDTSANGSYDIFISRLNDSLTELEASTYLGGNSADYVYGLSIAEDGNIFLTGITSSRDFPVTAGAFQTQYQGGEYDAFVVKISPDLDLLLGSTFLGGSGIDYGADLRVIPASYNNDTIVVVGMTGSADFPVTPGTYNQSLGGDQDAFVAVMSNSLGTMAAATFIGGSDYDIASAVAVDGPGHFWVAGRTRSADFPVTPGAFDGTYNGDYDGFVLHLNPQLNVLYSSTYIGGSGADFLYALGLEGEVNPAVYIAGYTSSSDYPVSENAYDKTFSGIYDVFVSKLDTSLNYLMASTFLGGVSEDLCRSLVVDASGNPYIAGWTRSASYPITSFTYDPGHNGGWDAFVTKLSVKLGAVLASTFIGGSADDLAYSLTVDSSGNVYITGYTQSSAFPMTEDTYDKDISGTDVFVARFAAVDSYQLTVSRSGEGSGSVTSLDGGIECGSDCSETYDEGFIVTLKAEPVENSVFGGWSGDVTSPDNPIYFKMDSNKNITASFVPAEATYTLTVVKSGPGNGTVTSEDKEIDCGDTCSATYPAGTLVKLTATPDESSGFERWDGDIYGTTRTVSFLMNGDKTVVAVFGPYPLSDLGGEWVSIKVSRFLGQTIVLSGFLKMINDGDGELKGNYKISYYLSADGQNLDTLIETRSLSYNLAPDSTRIITVAWYLSQNLNPVGQYLIAVLDADNEIEEKDETNNRVVFGPINATSENGDAGQEQKTGVKKLAEAIKNKIGK